MTRSGASAAKAIPTDLETICLKAIERAPGDRYPTASEMAEDLRRFLAHEPIAARRPGLVAQARRWSRRRPIATAVVGVALPSVVLLAAGSMAYRQQRTDFRHQREVLQAQQDAEREQLAAQKHRADVAELRSEQVLSQTLTAVFAAKKVREPDWAGTEKMLLSALLGGLEQGFEQMRLAPERNPAFGESALSIAKLRMRVDRTADAIEAFQLAIDDFDRRLQTEPNEELWQLLADALRGQHVG